MGSENDYLLQINFSPNQSYNLIFLQMASNSYSLKSCIAEYIVDQLYVAYHNKCNIFKK